MNKDETASDGYEQARIRVGKKRLEESRKKALEKAKLDRSVRRLGMFRNFMFTMSCWAIYVGATSQFGKYWGPIDNFLICVGIGWIGSTLSSTLDDINTIAITLKARM